MKPAESKENREEGKNVHAHTWRIGVVTLLLLVGCSDDPVDSAPAPSAAGSSPTASARKAVAPPVAKPLSRAELVAKGRRVYLSNCAACHNLDPSRKGSLGPAVSDSSEALIEARVVHGNYPPGYTPKADTHLMVAMPYLKGDVSALAAYLEN